MKMMTRVMCVAFAVLVVACGKDGGEKAKQDQPKVQGSPDWGDDPRPLGSCVGTVKPGVEIPAGAQASYCLEQQTAEECNAPSQRMDYVYKQHHTCASQGYAKQCTGGSFPASTRFKECPPDTTETP